MNFLIYILFCLLVILPIYKDCFLSHYIGYVGYTFMFVLSYLFFVLQAVVRKKIIIHREVLPLVKLGIYTGIVSIIGIVVWIVSGNSTLIYNENVLFQAIKLALTYFSYIIYINLLLEFMKNLTLEQIAKPIWLTLLILASICIVEKITMPYAFSSLHFAGTLPYYRVRLLTTEPSSTANLIYIYGMLSLYFSFRLKSRFMKWTTTVCIIILTVFTSSKALLGIVIVSIIIFVFLSVKKMNKRNIFFIPVVVVLLGIIYYVVFPAFQSRIQLDISKFTSVSTRIISCISGLIIGVINPFGVGWGIKTGVYANFLHEHMNQIANVLPFAPNMTELYVELSNGINLVVKSGIIEFHTYWGVVGTFVFVDFIIDIMKHIPQNQNKTLLLVFVISELVMITLEGFGAYEFWMLLAYLLHFQKIFDLNK